MHYKLAVFDMDGTILNTLEDLQAATNFCLRKYGMPERTLEEIRCFVGNGNHKLIERAVPVGTSAATIESILADFHGYYKEHCADKTCPYVGIPELLRTLRVHGVLTAVVSNKADYAVKSLCEQYFPGLFDFSAGDRPDRQRKPAPDMVNEAMEHFGIDRKDTVYIGDSEVDLATARNSKLEPLIVGWGFRPEEFLLSQGAGMVYHDPRELADVILRD